MSSTPPTSNRITEAAVANGTPYLVIISDGTPQMTKVTVSDGRQLGLIQQINWSIGVDGCTSRTEIETVASPAELKVWLKDVDLKVSFKPSVNPFRYLWDWTVAWVWTFLNR